MLHNVTNGCPRDFPSGILSVAGYAKHAVRCCNITEDECITPQPCHRETTYEEALKICSMQGTRLCPRTKRLNDICCKTVPRNIFSGANLKYGQFDNVLFVRALLFWGFSNLEFF